MSQHFTLRTANAALKVIKPLIEEILTIRQAVLDRQPEVWPVIQRAAGNGGSQAASQVAMEFGRLDALVHQVRDMGVLIKDINIGLLDFPAMRRGREIYLCWKYGEEKIAFWHEIGAGFAGRKPL